MREDPYEILGVDPGSTEEEPAVSRTQAAISGALSLGFRVVWGFRV